MDELISVIIPVYNVEQYLSRCVRSVQEQTYQNLEIILVDDESPDGCPALCDRLAGEDNRIRVIHQRNKGLSGARNTGIRAAKGACIAFVDSDDFIAPDFIGYLYDMMRENNCRIAQCRYEYVKGDGMTQSKKPGRSYVYSGTEMIANMYSPDGAFFVVAWNKLYDKNLFDDILYPEGKIHEDEATTHRLYFEAEKAVFTERYLYGYFVGGESITRKRFNKKRLDWAWAVEQRLGFLEEKGLAEIFPEALRAYADGVIDLYFRCRDGLPDSAAEQKLLKRKIKLALGRIRPYGRFPFKTAAGYRLFICCPWLYRILLKACSDEVLKEKVMETYDK